MDSTLYGKGQQGKSFEGASYTLVAKLLKTKWSDIDRKKGTFL